MAPALVAHSSGRPGSSVQVAIRAVQAGRAAQLRSPVVPSRPCAADVAAAASASAGPAASRLSHSPSCAPAEHPGGRRRQQAASARAARCWRARSSNSDTAAAAEPAAAAAEAAAAPAAPAKPDARAVFLRCWSLLQHVWWPVLVAHAGADAAIFLLHRVSHRLTNEAAVALLGGGMLTPEALGNMWWLSVDPAIANFQTGYQPLTIAFFLLAFPVNVLLKTWATLATILLCQRTQQAQRTGGASSAGAEGGGERAKWWQPVRGLKQALATLRALNPQIAPLWRAVFVVELLVAAVVVPLQFASLAVVTLPLTLPFILDLQAAGPAAVAEGVRGVEAVKRSRQLLRGLRWQLAIPYVALLLAGRALEMGKVALLNAMPARFYTQLVEIPVLVLVGGTGLSLLVARLQDILPFVAYTEGVAVEAAGAAAGAAAGGERGSGGDGGNGAAAQGAAELKAE